MAGLGIEPFADRLFFRVAALVELIRAFFLGDFAMRFALPVILAVTVVGCTPNASAPDPSIVPVNIESLYRVYRDSPQLAKSAWTQRRIRVVLLRRDYVVSGTEIHWHNSTPQNPPIVIFECDKVPIGEEPQVVVTGLCAGRVEDDDRPGPYPWFVSVRSCTVVPVVNKWP